MRARGTHRIEEMKKPWLVEIGLVGVLDVQPVADGLDHIFSATPCCPTGDGQDLNFPGRTLFLPKPSANTDSITQAIQTTGTLPAPIMLPEKQPGWTFHPMEQRQK